LRQVHGANVVGFDRPVPASDVLSLSAGEGNADDAFARATAPPVEPEADAAVTRERGVVLAILTADCLPILLGAEDGSEIGAAHAGWRGLAAGVVEACVARMQTPPARLVAWLGPAIAARS
jgi:purine-nucleoside/S-methyl-5'-thioadenosine phosphorylase / adenosine deaminase